MSESATIPWNLFCSPQEEVTPNSWIVTAQHRASRLSLLGMEHDY